MEEKNTVQGSFESVAQKAPVNRGNEYQQDPGEDSGEKRIARQEGAFARQTKCQDFQTTTGDAQILNENRTPRCRNKNWTQNQVDGLKQSLSSAAMPAFSGNEVGEGSQKAAVYAVILAAGSGQRVGGLVNKIYLPLAGKPLLEHTLLAFLEAGCFSGYLVVVRPGEEAQADAVASRVLGKGNYSLVPGGGERQDSVKNALDALPEDARYVAVHDAARCLVSARLIRRCVASALEYGSGVAACFAVDTVKEVAEERILATLPREKLALAQTPQVFLVEELKAAHDDAAAHGYRGTDDASLLERMGHQPHLVEGESRNLKVTHPEDFALASALFSHPQSPRMGMGYDVHRLVPGRKLVLGGVEIPHTLGLLGHSDADVLLHAIMDALLGAANLGDIGHLFPDTDPAYKDASSLALLEEVGMRIRAAGYTLSNLDATLALEAPKIAPHRDAMRKNIASALAAPLDAISVKATTTEGLGFVGRKEGAAAYAVCCLLRDSEI